MMTKKQKNKKLVSQNIRNKMLNRRYSSLTKFFLKVLKSKFYLYKKENFINSEEKTKILEITRKIESLLDKSVKRGVIHKNTSARKKSRLYKLFKKNILI
jgi:small subunit ribosomal protein S20